MSAAPDAAPERRRASPSPSKVPRIVVATTEITATWRVTPRAARSASFPNSSGYQRRVNPRHTKFRFESLKLKRIRIAIGANRKT